MQQVSATVVINGEEEVLGVSFVTSDAAGSVISGAGDDADTLRNIGFFSF